MKRLLLAFLLLATPAYGAEETYFAPVAATSFSTNVTTPATYALQNTGIRSVRLVSDQAFWFALAATPMTISASAINTNSVYVPANVPEYFRVRDNTVISIISSSSSGTVYITEMSP